MKTLKFMVRAMVAIVAIVLIWIVWAYDMARELRQKRRLGGRYEGPAED